MIVCIDTNVVVQLFGKTAPHRPILTALLAGKVALAVSNEILYEYQEVTSRMMSPAVWAQIQRAFTLMGQLHGNVLHVEPQFRFNVILDDPDDNKFCDCAIAVEADYVVTEDRHFLALEGSGYRPKPLSPQKFSQMILP